MIWSKCCQLLSRKVRWNCWAFGQRGGKFPHPPLCLLLQDGKLPPLPVVSFAWGGKFWGWGAPDFSPHFLHLATPLCLMLLFILMMPNQKKMYNHYAKDVDLICLLEGTIEMLGMILTSPLPPMQNFEAGRIDNKRECDLPYYS